MGKTSKYPAYTTGTINVNGQTKAQTSKHGNNVVTNYNMSDTEKQAYDYAQKTFANSLPSVNIFDEDTQKSLQAQLNAYTKQGQKMVDNIYTPMLDNLKNDIASRFGNFDNSVFMDGLKNIEANRADAINNLAQDITAKRSELINDELAQRYAYLNFLQDIQSQANSNILSFVNNSQDNSSSGNSYNAQAYNANQKARNEYTNLTSNILGNMGTYDIAQIVIKNIAKNYM